VILSTKELEALRAEMRQGREGEENYGLDRKKELPFLGLLKKEVYGVKDLAELSPEQKENLVRITKDILERIKADVVMTPFVILIFDLKQPISSRRSAPVPSFRVYLA
jgi:type I restriction enzyme R subunit